MLEGIGIGWIIVGGIVILLAVFGLIMLSFALIGFMGWEDLDEKYKQKREARQKAYDQIYEDPNRFCNIRKGDK